MQRSFMIFAIMLAILAGGFGGTAIAVPQAQPSAQAEQSASVNERLTVLANGLTVYVVQDKRFPLVNTRLYVRTGSANEQARLAGISHLLEHMVFKGSDHRPQGQVARDVERLGGDINASTSFDETIYKADLPAAHWRTGMDVVKDMAFQARLDARDLESEKDVVISELHRGKDNPVGSMYEALYVSALANTPYGRPIIGYVDTVKATTAADLRRYVDYWYQPQNMMLLVAGDVTPDAVLAYAEKLFGKLKNNHPLPQAALVDPAKAAGGPRVDVQRGPWNKVYLGLAFPAPDIKDVRGVDLDVLAYLLSGDGSAYFDRKYVYEKQLVDSISVSNMGLARAGLLTIAATLDADKVEAFWQELTRDLARVSADQFNEEAYSRARFNLADSMDRAGETLSGLTEWKGIVQFDLGGAQVERNMRATLARVDQNGVQQAIENWLRPERVRVRVLAPQDAAMPDLEAVLQKNWPVRAASADSTAQSLTQGRQEVVDLGQGRKLILIPDNTVPYVSLDLMFSGGQALLKPDQQGLANLTARLLTDGHGRMDREEVNRFLSERACSLGASAGKEAFSVEFSGPSRFSAEGFEMLRQMLAKPRFEKSELQREVEDIKSALRQRKDAPFAFIFSKLQPFLYPGHSYGYDRLGSEQNLAGFDRKDVKTFWEAQSARPWVLSVAGSFNRAEVLAFAKSLPVPTAPAVQVPQPQWGTERDLLLHLPGRNQAHVLEVFKTVPPTHPDAPALLLLESILSGQSGLLFRELRDEQGLGYVVTAFNGNAPQSGYLALYIGTTADKVEQARAGFAKVIADIKAKPLPASVLLAGSNSLRGEYLRGKQSLASRSGEAASNAVLDYPADFMQQQLDKIAKVTPAQVQAVACKYLLPERAYAVTLLP